MYKRQQEEIDQLEAAGKIFVIRPEFPVLVSRVEQDAEKLKALYAEGRRIGEEKLPALKEYLLSLIHIWQVFAPSYITPGEVDPTGCGNASTAAAMTGLVEKRSFEEVGAMAAVAASYNARQYGPMAFMNQERRSEAEKLVNMILKNPNKNDSIKGGSDNDKYKR